MNKTSLSPVLLSLLSVVAAAAPGQDTLADEYFSQQEPTLTPPEKAALAIGKKWQTGGTTSQPFAGANGAITYVYTIGQVPLRCAVLQVCDVALQPGNRSTTSMWVIRASPSSRPLRVLGTPKRCIFSSNP